MRSKVVAGCALLALALGAQAADASTAKPVLWLKGGIPLERAAPGTALTATMIFEGGCLDIVQQATLATNGRPTDKLSLASTAEDLACSGSGAKIAGSITGFTLKPAEEGQAAMTVKSAIHVFFEPWCVYAVPKSITMPRQADTDSEVTVPAPLVKSASFAACAPIRALSLRVTLREAEGSLHEPLIAEVVG
jgi:hypothetical protein